MDRRIFALIAAAVLIGCTPASSASVQGGGATLRPVCGPADGPAVLLEVPAPDSSRFRLRVSGSVGELAGREVVVRDAGDDDTYVDWCDGDDCRAARGGTTTVSFGPLRSDSSAAVRVRATGPDGQPFSWDGVAQWHEERPLCG